MSYQRDWCGQVGKAVWRMWSSSSVLEWRWTPEARSERVTLLGQCILWLLYCVCYCTNTQSCTYAYFRAVTLSLWLAVNVVFKNWQNGTRYRDGVKVQYCIWDIEKCVPTFWIWVAQLVGSSAGELVACCCLHLVLPLLLCVALSLTVTKCPSGVSTHISRIYNIWFCSS